MTDRWPTRQDFVDDLEGLESTVHAGSPRSPSNSYCHAEISDVVDLVWPEIERLRDLAYCHCGQGNPCTWRERCETTKAALQEPERQIRRLTGEEKPEPKQLPPYAQPHVFVHRIPAALTDGTGGTVMNEEHGGHVGRWSKGNRTWTVYATEPVHFDVWVRYRCTERATRSVGYGDYVGFSTYDFWPPDDPLDWNVWRETRLGGFSKDTGRHKFFLDAGPTGTAGQLDLDWIELRSSAPITIEHVHGDMFDPDTEQPDR